ncbi:hypothetical protein [Sphingomonas oligoaromativorans]|uniref:hypothetical protein n=1 Tax=Sphingomonas oligoaromativorans TaxID=575322 RepID=UPI0014230235|nr:hypothetical protein [Sphingomonas oligoaromativorans]NIJ32796.1 ribosomal protein L17 [Sphingomonas oligoaromativorans]
MATNPNYLASAPIATVDPNGPYAQGLALAQAQQQAVPPAPSVSPPPMYNALATPPAAAAGLPVPTPHRSFRDVIGSIGDVLGVLGGHAPVYKPYLQQQAFANWQANPEDPQAQANFLHLDPADAFKFMQERQTNRLSAMQTIANIEQTQRANAQAAVGRAATILKGVRDAAIEKGQDPSAALGAAYDNLRASGELDPIGMQPGEHDYHRDLIVSTPGVLDQLAAVPITVTAAGGANSPSTVLDARTGRPIGTGIAGVVPLGSDQLPYATAGVDPSTASNGGSIPASGGSSSSVDPSLGIVKGNNPGAIKDGAFARSQPGYAGADANGFATFKSPGQGIAAQERLLMGRSYFGGGNNTISGIVDTYLGPDNKENSPQSRANYKAYVSSQLGIAPDQPLSGQQLRSLATAMRNFETGQTGSAPVTAPGSIARGASAPTAGVQGAHWLESEKAGQLDPAALDQAAQTYILTGELPTSLGRNGIVQRQVLNAVAAKGFSGPQLKAIQARNASDIASLKSLTGQATAIQAQEEAAQANADLVLQKATAVTRSKVPAFNAWKNAADRHTGDPAISSLDAAIGTLISQFATVMGGGQPTDHLQKEWEGKISAAQSPQQLQEVIATMKQDMANRSGGYTRTIRQTSDRIGNSLPVPVKDAQQARALPPGTLFITPDGRFKTR